MQEFLRSSPAQAVIWVTVLLFVCALGIYLVQRLRDGGEPQAPSANDLLTGFREMQDEGELSTDEFRQIKTVLGRKLQSAPESGDSEGDD
jgi:hypothetical protein